VSNTRETIATVHHAVQAHPSTRVFSIGLGNGASHELVEGIAQAGRGTSAFCVGDDSLRRKVVAQLEHALQPALADVTIEWEEATGAPPGYPNSGLGELVETAAAEPTTAPPPYPGIATAMDAPAATAAAAAAGDCSENVGSKTPPSGSLLAFSARTRRASNPAEREGFAQAPFHPPPVHAGKRFLSYCLVQKGGRPPSAVRVTAKSPAGPLDVRLEVTAADRVEGTLLHTMAARALIHDLQRRQSWMHCDRPRPVDDATVKAEIVRLGTTYSLASQHTSFLAIQPGASVLVGQPAATSADAIAAAQADIDDVVDVMHSNIERVLERGEQLDCLVERSCDLGSQSTLFMLSSQKCRGGGFFDSIADFFGGGRRPKAQSYKHERRQGIDAASSCENSDMFSLFSGSMAGAAPPGAPPPTTTPPRRKDLTSPDLVLQTIVKQQDFGGSFDLTAALTALLGCDLDAALAMAARIGGGTEAKRLVATALAITFMRTALSSLEGEWKLVEAKAMTFIKRSAAAASVDSHMLIKEAMPLVAHAV